MNAADIGTRGAILKDLDFDSAWQRCLNFLCKPKNEWPEEPGERVNNERKKERKFANAGVACVNAGGESAIDLHRYSSLWKAKRMVASVLRCAKKFKALLTKDDMLVSRQPSLGELQQAETIIILCAQRESFSREISCLRHDLPIPNNSRLIKITPFINHEGLLRAKGRPYNVAIDFNAKDPVVVDAKSRFGELLIAHYHAHLAHGLPDYVYSEIRQRYWLVGGKSAVK